MRKTVLQRLTAIALLLTVGLSASAQTFQGLGFLQDIGSLLATGGKYIANVVWVICGIIIIVQLVPAGIKGLKGDPNAKDSITNVGIGAIVIFLILGVAKAAMGF